MEDELLHYGLISTPGMNGNTLWAVAQLNVSGDIVRRSTTWTTKGTAKKKLSNFTSLDRDVKAGKLTIERKSQNE